MYDRRLACLFFCHIIFLEDSTILRKKKQSDQKKPRINHQIRCPEVRLIDALGGQVGIVSVDTARSMADESQLDLVEVAPNAKPPVCRIMDFGKYRFEQNKKLKEAKKKQKNIVVKEIKFRPKIDNHDFMTKLKKVIEFLGKGCRVKVTIMFRGREMAYKERGKIILDRVIETIGDDKITVEQRIKTEGRNMMMTIAPKSGVEFSKNDVEVKNDTEEETE